MTVDNYRIAVIAGDGIGPEVIDAAIPILDAAGTKHRFRLAWERLPYSADHYLKTKETLPDSAFQWARAHGKTRVTMSDKSNAIPAHRVWQEKFEAIAGEYRGIEAEHRYVDALALELVRSPERFQVIVTNNLYGDILSDLGAGLVGGLGLAASANLHPGRGGLFEPVHGSAPLLAGQGIANPIAAVLTGALMFEQLGHAAAARDLERAVKETLAAGVRTPDLGGGARTGDVADAIAQRLS